MTQHTPTLTAIDDRIYGETPEDGLIAKVYGDAELAALFAAAPETAAERDRLREINADLLAALKIAHEGLERLQSGDIAPDHPGIPSALAKSTAAIEKAKARGQG